MIHQQQYTVNFFLMKKFNSSILKFLKLRGYNPPLPNIIKSSDLFKRLSEQNMSDIDVFYFCIKKYLDEKILEDIYFKLFHKDIWKPITKKKFNKMDLEARCYFVYENIPNHAKWPFQLHFKNFVIIHLTNIKVFEEFKKLSLIDNDSINILKNFCYYN